MGITTMIDDWTLDSQSTSILSPLPSLNSDSCFILNVYPLSHIYAQFIILIATLAISL